MSDPAPQRLNLPPRAAPLTGRFVRLDPAQPADAEALLAIGDDHVFRHMLRGGFHDLNDAREYLADAITRHERGEHFSYVIRRLAGGAVAGMTRLFDFSRLDRRLEIGHTWLGRAFQRTVVNTECKLLLLEYSFEVLGAVRVQLKTDAANGPSRRAIERIGAEFEGVLRKYQLTQGGRIRDTAMYSVTDDDWPRVRLRLQGLLTPDAAGPAATIA